MKDQTVVRSDGKSSAAALFTVHRPTKPRRSRAPSPPDEVTLQALRSRAPSTVHRPPFSAYQSSACPRQTRRLGNLGPPSSARRSLGEVGPRFPSTVHRPPPDEASAKSGPVHRPPSPARRSLGEVGPRPPSTVYRPPHTPPHHAVPSTGRVWPGPSSRIAGKGRARRR